MNFQHRTLQTGALGTGVENRTILKVAGRGCKRSFEPGGEGGGEKPFMLVQPGVAPMHNRVAHGARDFWETLCRGSKSRICA